MVGGTVPTYREGRDGARVYVTGATQSPSQREKYLVQGDERVEE